MFTGRYSFETRPLQMAPKPPGCEDCGQWTYELTELAHLVAERCPTKILELGTYRGGTLYSWLTVLQHGGTCYTIDDRPPLELWQTWASQLGVKTVNYQGDTRARASLAFAETHAPYDFLFIDANHTEAGVTADFLDYAPLVKPCGLLAFHDILGPGPGGLLAFHDILGPGPARNQDHIRVSRLWKRIQQAGYVTRELITHPEQTWGGIGVVFL